VLPICFTIFPIFTPQKVNSVNHSFIDVLEFNFMLDFCKFYYNLKTRLFREKMLCCLQMTKKKKSKHLILVLMMLILLLVCSGDDWYISIPIFDFECLYRL